MKDLQELASKMKSENETLFRARDQFYTTCSELIEELIKEVDPQQKSLSLEGFKDHYSFISPLTEVSKTPPTHINLTSDHGLYLVFSKDDVRDLEKLPSLYLSFLMTWIVNAYELED